METQKKDEKTTANGVTSTLRLDFPTWDEAISGITDSRFVGHQKIPRLNTNCTRDGARIMYDRLYVLMKSNGRDEMQRSCHIHCAGSTARSAGNRANVSSRAFSGRASRAENGAGEPRR